MTTRFLLDGRKLDDCIDGQPNLEIIASAAAYFRRGHGGFPNYAFYVGEVDKENVPLRLLKLPHSEAISPHELAFRYQRANVLFLPVSDTWSEQGVGDCQLLFVRGDFLKGNADKFKKCGVTILSS